LECEPSNLNFQPTSNSKKERRGGRGRRGDIEILLCFSSHSSFLIREKKRKGGRGKEEEKNHLCLIGGPTFSLTKKKGKKVKQVQPSSSRKFSTGSMERKKGRGGKTERRENPMFAVGSTRRLKRSPKRRTGAGGKRNRRRAEKRAVAILNGFKVVAARAYSKRGGGKGGGGGK